MLHAAFHVIAYGPIISALFPEVFAAFSLHGSFSFGTVKARSSSISYDSLVDCCKDKIDRTDSIAFDRRCLLHVDANTFCQQFRYCTISMTFRDTIFERVYSAKHLWTYCGITSNTRYPHRHICAHMRVHVHAHNKYC